MPREFERWLFSARPWWQDFVIAALIPLLASGLWQILGVREFPLSLVLLFAVAGGAFFGGFWASLVALIVSLLVANPLFLDARLTAAQPGSLLPALGWTIPFVISSVLVSFQMDTLRRFARRNEASKQLYVSTLANVSDAILTTDKSGRIEYMNRAAMLLLKRDLKDVAGYPIEEVVDIRDETSGRRSATVGEQVRSAFATVHASKGDVLCCPDGRRIPVIANAVPVRTAAGELMSVVISIHDCSEQRRSERALQERLALQARLESIAEVVPGAVYEFRRRPDGRRQLTYASRSFNEIFGLDPRTLRDDATRLVEVVHVEDLQRLTEAANRAERRKEAMSIEYRINTPHRGVRWVALVAAPSQESDGGMLWRGVYTDVTERKRAEERHRASELQLMAALEAGDMGVFSIDLTARTVEMDAAARRLWGLQSTAHPTLTIDDLLSNIDPDDVASVRDEFRHLDEFEVGHDDDSGLRSSEYRLRLDGGSARWLMCRGRIYIDENTGHRTKVGVIIDVTSQRRTEEQRLNSQKLESLGVLAGGIAHDFNNILLAISGNARLLLEDMEQNEPMRTSVTEINKAAARATDLVKRILAFSRQGEPASGPQPTLIRPVLDEVIGLVRAAFPATVSVRSEIPDDLPAVLADGTQIHQVLINLLTNAADAAVEADGVIRLRVDVVTVGGADGADPPDLQRGEYVRIGVSDRGKGISRDIQRRIFDPFFTTKPKGKGTGLGLATVHGIMKAIDGAVTVDSEPGKGATFSLYFPAQDVVVAVGEVAGAVQKSMRSANILFVDDEEILIYLMTRTLQRMGHRVTAFASPQDALDEFRKRSNDFDLVVSDMTMLGMSGLELAEQMLAIDPDVNFVITTGYVDAEQVARAQAIGVQRVIMKPNSVDELTDVLNEILMQEPPLAG